MIAGVPVSGPGLTAVELGLSPATAAADEDDHTRAGESLGGENKVMTSEVEEEAKELQAWKEKLIIAEREVEDLKKQKEVLYERWINLAYRSDLERSRKMGAIEVEDIKNNISLPECTPEQRKKALDRAYVFQIKENAINKWEGMTYNEFVDMARRNQRQRSS